MSYLAPSLVRRIRAGGVAPAVALLCALLAACSAAGRAKPVAAPPAAAVAETLPVASGFLSDYSVLRPSAQFPTLLLYRDSARKGGFHKVLFRPVDVWRGSDHRLEDIPEADLQYLADSFYRAVESHLKGSFEMVDTPGPGVLEIQLALTLVTKEEQPIDFFSATVPVRDLPPRPQVMSEATQRFVRACALEAEFAESTAATKKTPVAGKAARPKRTVVAAFFDTRRGDETPKGSVESWADVDAVFAKWATALDDQLVALRKGTFKPRFTVAEPTKPASAR
jgi:hypothetical protein